VLPVTIVFFQHISSMPLFVVRDLGLSAANFGLLFSLNCLLIVVLEVPLNAVTAHWSHRRTLALGAVLSGAGFGAMAFARGFREPRGDRRDLDLRRDAVLPGVGGICDGRRAGEPPRRVQRPLHDGVLDRVRRRAVGRTVALERSGRASCGA
jgi:hypothetical protein